jgi:hypothetical protein
MGGDASTVRTHGRPRAAPGLVLLVCCDCSGSSRCAHASVSSNVTVCRHKGSPGLNSCALTLSAFFLGASFARSCFGPSAGFSDFDCIKQRHYSVECAAASNAPEDKVSQTQTQTHTHRHRHTHTCASAPCRYFTQQKFEHVHKHDDTLMPHSAGHKSWSLATPLPSIHAYARTPTVQHKRLSRTTTHL